MNMDMLIADSLEVLGCNMPALIMLIVGISVTFANRQRNPKAARWAMLGFGWLFCTDIAAIAWMRFGIFFFFPGIIADDPEQVISMVVLSCCEGLGYFFFLFALNAAFSSHRPRGPYDEFDDIDIRRPGF
jgi:hypothetical protein